MLPVFRLRASVSCSDFHSTMVRLRREWIYSYINCWSSVDLFPFHYGSIETKGTFTLYHRSHKGDKFPFHNGSIETLFSLSIIGDIKYFCKYFYLVFFSPHPSPSSLAVCIAIHNGAIEPWLLTSGFRSLLRFPFHNGSIETCLSRLKRRDFVSEFPFHYGSIETIVSLPFQSWDAFKFPFHNGSIETLKSTLSCGCG